MGDQNETNNAINLHVSNARNNKTAPKTVFYFLLKSHPEGFQVLRNSVRMVTTAKVTEAKLREKKNDARSHYSHGSSFARLEKSPE